METRPSAVVLGFELLLFSCVGCVGFASAAGSPTALLRHPRTRVPAPNRVWTGEADGMWAELPPPSRFEHAAIYDPIRDRMIVFGGRTSKSNEVWTFSLADGHTWAKLPTKGAPPSPRVGMMAIYDAPRDRMVIAGGFDYVDDLNDTWALTLADTATWSEIVPSGVVPPSMYEATAIYEPLSQRMVVQGNGPAWALELAGTPRWTSPFSNPGPSCASHSAVYDSNRDHMLVFGGVGGAEDSVWVLSFQGFGSWGNYPRGAPSPPRLRGHAAAFDPDNDRMLIFGGTFLSGGTGASNVTWSFSPSPAPHWEQLSIPNPPGPRDEHTAIYDPVRKRMIVFGGYGHEEYASGLLNDVWALSLTPGTETWTQLVTTPTPRYGQSAIYDPQSNRMVVFGGQGLSSGPFLNDVWEYSLSGDPRWSPITPSGEPPSPRSGHSAVYDPIRNRMLVFGGSSQSVGQVVGDLWALSLDSNPAWTQLTTTGPAARDWHTAIYDPVRDRMIVYGGRNGVITGRNDAWSFSLAEPQLWQEIQASGIAPARVAHGAVYDPVGDRMLVWGGTPFPLELPTEVWSLSLGANAAWESLTVSGDRPPGRLWARAVYDGARQRLIVHGGRDWYSNFSDSAWALSLTSSPTWSKLSSSGLYPPSNEQHSAIYDAERDRMVIFGGAMSAETWELNWSGHPTATLLERFETETTHDGVRLWWRFESPEVLRAVLERSSAESGPWKAIAVDERRSNDLVAVLDREVDLTRVHFYRLVAELPNGLHATFGPITSAGSVRSVGITSILPNPAMNRFRIDYDVEQPEDVRILIMDVAGRRVKELIHDRLAPGRYSVTWDAHRERVAAGVYFLHWESPGHITNQRLVLLQ